MIQRTVEQVFQSYFKPVFVYSDSEEIRNVAMALGAMIPPRPENVSRDESTSEESMISFINQYGSSSHEAFALIQCTTPFLTYEHLNKVYEEFKTGKYDSVITVTKMDRFLGYPHMDQSTMFIPIKPYRELRQNCSWSMYMENGGCYLATKELWKSGRRIGLRCGIVTMGWWESLEIDEPLDLEVARLLAPIMENRDGEEER